MVVRGEHSTTSLAFLGLALHQRLHQLLTPVALASAVLQLVVFDACGHMPQEECPEQFVETVQRFVASLDQPANQEQQQAGAQANGA